MTQAFSHALIQWYQEYHRDLPWRNTNDPYKIWLSEIILQQTRVNQGLPYYEKFVEKYPTVQQLATADLQEVLRTWQGLGYYSRARNLHKCAQVVCSEYAGKFPETYDKLIKLPGIGPYTAAAIASFAFSEHKAVVDGNVLRVLSRYFGVKADISSGKGMKVFRELAQNIIPKKSSDTYNQAIMEFGARQCTPGIPDCPSCPINIECVARRKKIQNELPVKLKRTKSKVVHFTYFLIQQGDTFLLRERTEGIWTGLFEYWLIEENIPEPESWLKDQLQDPFKIVHIIEKTHQLSHRTILAHFVWIKQGPTARQHSGFGKFNRAQVEQLPKPILIEWHLTEVVDATLEG